MQTINTWETTKPWINATDKTALLEKVQAFSTWLTDAVAAQNALAAHEVPTLTSNAVVAKRNELQRAFNKVNNIRKPKEPKKKVIEGEKEPEAQDKGGKSKDMQEEPLHDEL